MTQVRERSSSHSVSFSLKEKLLDSTTLAPDVARPCRYMLLVAELPSTWTPVSSQTRLYSLFILFG